MSVERLKHIKETLLSCVESQIYDLSEVDAEELGEVVDMIKDIDEALYYCSVVKAMEEHKEEPKEPMYYRESPRDMGGNDRVRYYGGGYGSGGRGSSGGGSNSGGGSWSGSGSSGNGNGSSDSGGSSQYSEREYPYAFNDEREGRSPRSRRMYMEAKETKQDKALQMRELEKYMQELATDITEMVQDASPEERQFLSKKISALATKIQ